MNRWICETEKFELKLFWDVLGAREAEWRCLGKWRPRIQGALHFYLLRKYRISACFTRLHSCGAKLISPGTSFGGNLPRPLFLINSHGVTIP
jgi:hypothetical protein